MKKSLVTISILALTACGGGGGGSSDQPSATSPDATLVASNSYALNESVEIALLSPEQEISNVQWRQVTGESVTFHAANSKVVSFTPRASGDYSFEVSFTHANGENATLSHELSVLAEPSSLTALLSHSVIEGNKVSLRAYYDEDVSVDSLKWTQTSGPQTTLTGDATNGNLDEMAAIFFDAPSVSQDSIITFDVTLTSNNETYTDSVTVLVENSNINVLTTETSPFDSRLANVHAYKADSPYANSIVNCVYSNTLTYSNSCRFSTLPLIAHDSETPSVDDIMNRVVVSHDWMGQRFQEWIEAFDEHDDFKNLLRATTAIVLSYDIRPSFYHPYTGAIYLDPDDLWLSPEERDTINQAPDFRSAFGSELQFEMPWRYTLNNDSVYYFPYIEQRASRELSHTKYAFASLLYHELAHANDYFPKTIWNNISLNERAVDFSFNRIVNESIMSSELTRQLPLVGSEMRSLAQVRFQGADATSTQKALSTDDVASLFQVEAAPQFYSYSSTREDYAILFDGLMMRARYNVMRDVAVSDQEYDNVAWGQRGREGEEQIKPRLKFTLEAILPEFSEANGFIDDLPAPIALPTGVHWRDTRELPETAPKHAKQHSFAEHLLRVSDKPNVRLMPIENRRYKEIELN